MKAKLFLAPVWRFASVVGICVAYTCSAQLPIGLPGFPSSSSTITISKGGTYSGTWSSNSANTAAVTVSTTEPVIIENSTVSGRGDLISIPEQGANVTVRNVTGTGLDPQVIGSQRGMFVRASSPTSLVVQNCTMTGTSFGVLVGYYAVQNLKILNNKAVNLEDRASNGLGGFLPKRPVLGHFIQLTKMTAPNGAEIAWNEMKQTVGSSSTEDGVNIYVSSGSASAPIWVHDNYMEGNSSPVSTTYSGSGFLSDGASTGDTGYILMQSNQVVHTQGGGMAIASGHDVTLQNNRVVSCGQTASGTWYSAPESVAVGLVNYYNNPVFYNNLITSTGGGLVTRDNSNNILISDVYVGSVDSTSAVRDNDFTDPCITPSGTIDTSAETQEQNNWQAKLTANNQTIGDQH